MFEPSRLSSRFLFLLLQILWISSSSLARGGGWVRHLREPSRDQASPWRQVSSPTLCSVVAAASLAVVSGSSSRSSVATGPLPHSSSSWFKSEIDSEPSTTGFLVQDISALRRAQLLVVGVGSPSSSKSRRKRKLDLLQWRTLEYFQNRSLEFWFLSLTPLTFLNCRNDLLILTITFDCAN